MARILDCWEIGNGLAYIEGLAISAKLLAKKGHDVRFAGRDLSHAERIFGSRIRYYQAPTQVVPVAPHRQLRRPMNFADVLINLGLGSAGTMTARVRAWRRLFEGLKPDVVRCASAPGALLAARGTGIRTLVMGIGSLVPPNRTPLPLSRSWLKGGNDEAVAMRERRANRSSCCPCISPNGSRPPRSGPWVPDSFQAWCPRSCKTDWAGCCGRRASPPKPGKRRSGTHISPWTAR